MVPEHCVIASKRRSCIGEANDDSVAPDSGHAIEEQLLIDDLMLEKSTPCTIPGWLALSTPTPDDALSRQRLSGSVHEQRMYRVEYSRIPSFCVREPSLRL